MTSRLQHFIVMLFSLGSFAGFSQNNSYQENILFSDGMNQLWLTDGTRTNTIPTIKTFFGGLRVIGKVSTTWFYQDENNTLFATQGFPTQTYTVPIPNGPTGIDKLVVIGDQAFFVNAKSVVALTRDAATHQFRASVFFDLPSTGTEKYSTAILTKLEDRLAIIGRNSIPRDTTTMWLATLRETVPRFVASMPGTLAMAPASTKKGIFFGLKANHVTGLWYLDGQLDNVIKLRDFPHDASFTSIQHLTAFGDKLIFNVTDKTNGSEPWISSGTSASTHMLTDLAPGRWDDPENFLYPHAKSSNPKGFSVFGGVAYFWINGSSLWKTDGTEVGTKFVINTDYLGEGQALVAGSLFFTNHASNRLYQFDIESQSIRPVRMANDSLDMPWCRQPEFFVVDNRPYLAGGRCDSGVHDKQRSLWTVTSESRLENLVAP
jgi:ELWxxDGT repeat protein